MGKLTQVMNERHVNSISHPYDEGISFIPMREEKKSEIRKKVQRADSPDLNTDEFPEF